MVPANAVFALRAGIFEVNRLIEKGLTEDEFDLTRDFLVSYSKLWARSLSDRLAFHMDSRYYGMPYFIDEIERRLAKLTAEEVNRAVKDRFDPFRGRNLVDPYGHISEIKVKTRDFR